METLVNAQNKKAGTSLHGDKKTNWQQMGNAGTIYKHTHKHQLKVIKAEADDQVGGWNHTSRGGGSGKRWEVNTQNKNRDKTITWTQA